MYFPTKHLRTYPQNHPKPPFFGTIQCETYYTEPAVSRTLGRYLGVCQNFSARGVGPLNVNLGPPIISETIGARKFKLKTQLHVVKYSLRYKNLSARWRPGGAGPPNVNLRPLGISETTTARKLNLKIPLDMAKYPTGYNNY